MLKHRTMLIVFFVTALAGCASLDQFVSEVGRVLPGAVIRDASRRDTGDTSRRDTSRRDTSQRGSDRPRRSASARGVPPPIFGDWWYTAPEAYKQARVPAGGDPCAALPRFVYERPNTYVPINVPGAAHGGPSFVPGNPKAWRARCMAQKLSEAGAPVAVLIRERNCPYPFNTNGRPTSPGEVKAMLDAVPRLDYLFMDLEPNGDAGPRDVQRNVEAIVRMVRSHPNPRVSGAFIGNYNDWPGRSDRAKIWPNKRDRTRVAGRWDRDAFYRANLNVAMPICYPYRVFSKHTEDRLQKGDSAPNDRAAEFWAPLERLSVAARNLPEGHLLIPWVTPYATGGTKGLRDTDYRAPPPPRADLEALIRHLRLRGAYSYYAWTSSPKRTYHPTIDHDTFTALALNAWGSLDPLFTSGSPGRILNLDTDKASGVQWSGMVVGDRVWVLVSNLGNTNGARVDLPDLPGLPDRTPPVPRGSHRLFRWKLNG